VFFPCCLCVFLLLCVCASAGRLPGRAPAWHTAASASPQGFLDPERPPRAEGSSPNCLLPSVLSGFPLIFLFVFVFCFCCAFVDYFVIYL